MKRILAVGKSIYHAMPACLRYVFSPARLISRLLDVLKVNVWIITGDEISSKQKLVIIYAGHEVGKNYLADLAFGGSHRDSYVGRKWLWKIPKTVDESPCDCSLMITEAPKVLRILFRKRKYLYVPCWVSGEIDVSGNDCSFLKNESLKSDVRKIRKNKLHFEATNRPSDLRDFYYNMYIPYITKTHGNRSEIVSYDFVKSEFGERRLLNDLLLIKKEEEYVAGILLGFKNNRAQLWYLGVKDGNLDYVQDGAIGALFYFSVRYLEGKGFTRIGFGRSRPFLRDGVLRFKRKWNPRIFNEYTVGFVIRPLSWADGVKGFFLNNPFIYEDKAELNGALFVPGDRSLSTKDLEKIHKDYYLKGLSKLVVYRFGEVDSNTLGAVPREYSGRMTICSVETIL